ncbi:hypothetical protein NC652_040664 [Populus alba x Populus x berolinensis]|nr:hypothetical protein NC652_040664 [Populus alba x Populus x berolinensis]
MPNRIIPHLLLKKRFLELKRLSQDQLPQVRNGGAWASCTAAAGGAWVHAPSRKLGKTEVHGVDSFPLGFTRAADDRSGMWMAGSATSLFLLHFYAGDLLLFDLQKQIGSFPSSDRSRLYFRSSAGCWIFGRRRAGGWSCCEGEKMGRSVVLLMVVD